MIEVMGENYYIDLDEIERYVDMNTVEISTSGETEMRINIVKYEIVKLLLDVVFTDEIPMEDNLGLKNTKPKMSVPFKIAFNSLLNKKIIKYF